MATRPAAGTVTLLFTDLVDSTGVLQRLGEEGAEQFRRTHFRLLREAVADHQGEEVKNLGDGLMVAFASALSATRCAIAMQQAVERYNRRGGEPLAVRVGLHVGEPIRDEEDYFGTPVVVAKRLCDSAGGGQILATELLRELIGTRTGLSLLPLGPRVLKGLSGPVAACEVAWEPSPDAAVLPQLALTGRSPFVGREREVTALETMLLETASGRGRVVLVSGEPGIGKTRLLMEVAGRAASRGWLTLFGRAYESEGMPPYLPFIEALRLYVRACPPASLRAQLGRGAPDVALLVPELFERVAGIEARPPLSRDERYRLFEGVAGFILNAANAQQPGILFVVDDLHWADPATLLLLQHLARRLSEAPLLIAATCRTTDVDRSRPFVETLAQLHRERLCAQVEVGAFTNDETRRLVERLAANPPSPQVIASVHRRTGGNPFFLEEVVRGLATEGRDGPEGRVGAVAADVPETVRQVIGSRLSRLQPATLRALQVASALGDPFSFDTLAAVEGTDLATLLDALDEASGCGFVGEEREGDYRFSHALVRETVYAGLSAPRRALLHARVAEALAALCRANTGPHAGELARHLLLGGRRDDLAKAMAFALQAADRATAQMAFEEAVRYARMALDAHERSQEQDDLRYCEMLLALATATFKAGDWRQGDEINLVAARAAEAAGLSDLLVRACLATAATAGPMTNPLFIPLLENGLQLMGASDSTQRSGLLSLLAYQLAKAGTWEGPAAIREESIAMARRLGEARALAFALRNCYLGRNLNDIGRLEEHLRAVEEVVDLARELGDKELEVTSQCDHLTGSLVLGDIAAVDQGIAAHVRLGDELQQRVQMWHGLVLRRMRALLSGPLSRVEQLENEYQLPWGAVTVHPFRLILLWEQGRLAELREVAGATRDGHAQPLALAHFAFVRSELGDIGGARSLVEQLAADRFAAIPVDFDWPFALSLLSQACASIRDTDHAEVLYELLLPRAMYVVTPDSAPVCLGSTSRYLGLLATTLGRFSAAERHFDDSDAMNTRLGALPLLAHTQVDRARLHVARGGPGDLARAERLLGEAGAAFEGLGMDYHATRAHELRAALPSG